MREITLLATSGPCGTPSAAPPIATGATRELACVVMLDAAGLRDEEARRALRSNRRGEPVTPPLYTIDDAPHALDYFGPDVGYDEAVLVTDGISARFMAGPVTPWSASPAWERTHAVDVVLACNSSVMAAPFGHRTYPLRFSDPTARGMTQRATQFSPHMRAPGP